MTELLHLQNKLRTTGAAIGRLEAELSQKPSSRGLFSNLLSLRKLHHVLSVQFQSEADKIGLDICRYKMLEDRPTVRALSRAIGAFQDTFSLMYESLRSGPMTRRYIPRDTLQATELHIAYTFPGSFGVVLTVSRDVLLFPEWSRRADEAIDVVFGVVKSRSPKEVAQVAHQVGRAPIAALYDWAKGNALSKSGAELDWNRTSSVRRDVVLQYPEFAELSASIEETSEERIEVTEYRGVLVGADTKSRRFHFVTEDDRDIRGRFTDAISETQKAQLPARYVAKIQSLTRINFARAEEEISYDLLFLTSLLG